MRDSGADVGDRPALPRTSADSENSVAQDRQLGASLRKIRPETQVRPLVALLRKKYSNTARPPSLVAVELEMTLGPSLDLL